MKRITKYFNLALKVMNNFNKVKNILVLVILTRLLFLEYNQLALIAEILGSVVVLLNPLTPLDIPNQ